VMAGQEPSVADGSASARARGNFRDSGVRTLKIDISFSTYGLPQAQSADATLFRFPNPARRMDSYARGVNAFIEQHKRISRGIFTSSL